MDQIAGFGRFAQFSMSAFKWLFRGVGRWGRLSLLSPQLFSIGTRSIPVIMLLGLFIGMVLAIETFEQFDAFGIADSLGAIINISVVKQIGPVLAAVMLAGRVEISTTAAVRTAELERTVHRDSARSARQEPLRAARTKGHEVRR